MTIMIQSLNDDHIQILPHGQNSIHQVIVKF